LQIEQREADDGERGHARAIGSRVVLSDVPS